MCVEKPGLGLYSDHRGVENQIKVVSSGLSSDGRSDASAQSTILG